MFSKKGRRGEITTIITLGVMAFILFTTATSSLFNKKPQTTSAKAALACPGGIIKSGTAPSCNTICSPDIWKSTYQLVGSMRSCCCSSSSGVPGSAPACKQGTTQQCPCTCAYGCDTTTPTKCAKASTTSLTCKQGTTQQCPCTCAYGCDSVNTTKCAKSGAVVTPYTCAAGQNKCGSGCQTCPCTCNYGCDLVNPTKCAKAAGTTVTCKQGTTQACPCTCSNGCDSVNKTQCARETVTCEANYVWQGNKCWNLHVNSKTNSGIPIPLPFGGYYCGNSNSEELDTGLCGTPPITTTCTIQGTNFSSGVCYSLNSKLVNGYCENEVVADSVCGVYEVQYIDSILKVDCNKAISFTDGTKACLVIGTDDTYAIVPYANQ